jgi:uncharacterized protein YhfF
MDRDDTCSVRVQYDGLPISEFAFPGPLRDRLVAAVLDGSKTATTSTLVEYSLLGDPMPVAGARAVVIDSRSRPVAITETTEVRIVRAGEVNLQHAIDEGEGYTSVAQWRADHETFWHGAEFRQAVGDPTFRVDDDTLLVLERFRVVQRLDVDG